MRIKNRVGGGSVWSDLKKTRLLHLGNVEKPPHPQFSAQRAPEGLRFTCICVPVERNVIVKISFNIKPNVIEITNFRDHDVKLLLKIGL